MTNFQTAREAMVDCQVRPSDVTKYPIIDALLKTPKEKYVPLEKQTVAYVGEHITLLIIWKSYMFTYICNSLFFQWNILFFWRF